MLGLDRLQFLAQIVDDMEIAIEKLEKSYEDNDSEKFKKSKETVLEFQQKISEIISEKNAAFLR